MKRKWIADVATALVVIAAAAVLIVAVRRVREGQGAKARMSDLVINNVLAPRRLPSSTPIKADTRQRELVGVLITTSTCAGTSHPDFVPAVHAMKAELARRAKASGRTLRLVGVAMDERAGDGLALLDRIGPFDEVSVGGNILNSNMIQYMWRSPHRSTKIPQWVIFERDVVIGEYVVAVTPDSVIAVVTGAENMRSWVRTSSATALSRDRRTANAF